MKMQEVREIAKSWNVNIRVGRSKQDIIRDIQTSEGNSPCFRTQETCDQHHCLWFDDCLKH